jgi:molybdate transport system substrate-binding protein
MLEVGMSRRSFVRASALALCLLGAARGAAADEPALSVAAAMSLRNVMPVLMDAFRAGDHGALVQASYGASGALRQQVEGGAPIDVVVFADSATVEALIKSGHADESTRRVVASNALILIGPRNPRPLTFHTIDDLPAGEMIAIGEPGAVPAGRYAKEAFEKLGKWDKLAGHLVLGGDVGAVLNYARRGEVAAAVVYRTDVRGVDDVVVLDQASGDWAPKAQVVAAVVKGSPRAARAAAFVAYLGAAPAQKIFADYGFGAPRPA